MDTSSISSMPPPTQEFLNGINSLVDYDQDKYMYFFKSFGTPYQKHTTFGSALHYNTIWSDTAYLIDEADNK
eukprot:CAMPEP_0176374144 /NCGR_PEP_ID=MMETSP0126-20121128/26549_1 /TAXON_ID=141414 ORGANISM="Strombidinopsis acuminatum, Strain SPMC142" /NCGR_SAMPLE_ID=MMETSP0126 /ASSEMBLY_ACC=CAM_ASM_000229 /LENGTH=71 /DNA_ID=CAMNT_0017734597 /DNA_START=119 /DNA_END=334 /DNA_ORIENTATION=+